MGSDIQLGAFALEAVLASGGMAEVWRGVHRASGRPVAVKLMRTDGRGGVLWHSAFRAEVRAMARLNHPAVVRIHDYGTVGEDVEALVPGTPWLAMELVEGGTLADRAPTDWPGVQQVLAELLDALAEAHAHDVVHRDLKPANVLVAEDGSVKLTDFGIAHAMDRLSRPQASLDGGTPPFMAPEQFQGRFRDTGPWTDLYALGCLGWYLVCGRPPYGHESHWMRAAMAHAERSLPSLSPRFGVPDGLECWLHRLLQKAPADRFAMAADAGWALALLGEAPAGGAAVPPSEPERDTLVNTPWRRPAPSQLPTQVARVAPGKVPVGAGNPMPVNPPPVPVGWESPREASGPLAGAGLGLFGLRALPLVGRQEQRDGLWQALREAVRDQAPRLVVLTGGAGHGKSRLAEWFVQRTLAVGAARWSVAVHGQPPGPEDGVGAMVQRDLRLHGLPAEAAVSRIRTRLVERGVFDGDELGALAALTLNRSTGTRTVRFGAPAERFALVERHLRRETAGRIAGLWVDDAQWGLDALQLCGWLLGRARFGLVMVLTVRDEGLEGRAERAVLEELVGRPGVQSHAVGPLSVDEQQVLLGRGLGLGPRLAEQVVERTGGNPLFAVQLVGDWVDRELLEPTEAGFELRDGAVAEIPDDLHEMWLARVDRVVASEPGWRGALHLASALGMEVDLEDWRGLCARLALPEPDGLVDALVRAKLARTLGPERVRFEHALMRESVERDAVERGVWEVHNLACANWFRERGTSGRGGRHTFAAGRFDQAVDLLLAETRSDVFSTELRLAEASIALAERAMEASGASPRDPRWGAIRVQRARVLDDRGEAEAAYRLADETRELALERGWPRHEAAALMRMGAILRDRPDVPRARARYTEALERWRALGDREQEALALHELGRVAMFAGEYAQSQALHHEAMAIFDDLDLPEHTGAANCHRALGELAAWRRGDLEVAARHLRIAAERYRALGMRFGEASCLNGQAEIARHQGDLEAAEAGYRAAIRLTEAMGHDGGDVMRINVGICRLEAGAPGEAIELLESVRGRLASHERWGLVGFIDVVVLTAMAELDRWEDWAGRLERAAIALREASLIDHDLARFAERAATLAEAAERVEEGAQARKLQAWQLEAMGLE